MNNLATVARAFEEHEVEWLLVGGSAVAIYGYSRLTTLSDGTEKLWDDIDVWFNPN